MKTCLQKGVKMFTSIEALSIEDIEKLVELYESIKGRNKIYGLKVLVNQKTYDALVKDIRSLCLDIHISPYIEDWTVFFLPYDLTKHPIMIKIVDGEVKQ